MNWNRTYLTSVLLETNRHGEVLRPPLAALKRERERDQRILEFLLCVKQTHILDTPQISSCFNRLHSPSKVISVTTKVGHALNSYFISSFSIGEPQYSNFQDLNKDPKHQVTTHQVQKLPYFKFSCMFPENLIERLHKPGPSPKVSRKGGNSRSYFVKSIELGK